MTRPVKLCAILLLCDARPTIAQEEEYKKQFIDSLVKQGRRHIEDPKVTPHAVHYTAAWRIAVYSQTVFVGKKKARIMKLADDLKEYYKAFVDSPIIMKHLRQEVTEK